VPPSISIVDRAHRCFHAQLLVAGPANAGHDTRHLMQASRTIFGKFGRAGTKTAPS
jgi:hypothetical protein